VETTAEDKPLRARYSRVASIRRVSAEGWAVRHPRPAGPVRSDGPNAFRGIGDVGCCHRPIVTGSGRKAATTPAFRWANTLPGSPKAGLAGAFHAIHAAGVGVSAVVSYTLRKGPDEAGRVLRNPRAPDVLSKSDDRSSRPALWM
jgi:hypothetical protein